MQDKVVLITGASAGIGEATALHFADIGYRKFALVARGKEKLQELANKLRAKGATKLLLLAKDLYEPTKVCESIINEVIAYFGRLDIFFSNAGIFFGGNTGREIQEDQLNKVMNLNFISGVYLSKYALPHLEKTKGTIIFNSGVFGKS